MVASPYAIRYATESAHVLARDAARRVRASSRSSGRSSGRRSAGSRSSRCSSRSFVYTQYWSFYLLVVVVALLGLDGVARHRREAALRLLVAMAVGGLAFVPWVPTFLYQARTPVRRGARRCCPASRSATRCATSPAARAEPRPTARKAGCCSSSCCRCCCSACSAGRIDDRRVEIDLHGPARDARDRVRRRRGLVVGADRSTTSPAARSSRATARSCSRSSSCSSRVASRRCAIRGSWARCSSWRVGARLRRGRAQRVDPTHAGRRPSRRSCATRRSPATSSCTAPTSSGPSVHRLVQPGLDEVVYPSFAGPNASTGSTTRRGSPRPTPRRSPRAALAPRGRTHDLVRQRARLHDPRRQVRSDLRRARRDRAAGASARLSDDEDLREARAPDVPAAPAKR